MLGATAALAAASAVLAGPAAAATTGATATSTATHTPKTFARLVGPVVADPKNPEIGYVTAVYRCSGEGALWVSVKQTADRSRDPRLTQEGSSQISAAWSDSHRNAVTCDGRTRLQVFTVDQEEPAYPSNTPKSGTYGPLERGWGWVQFCLFDANYTQEPYSENAFRRVLAKH
jgi:poly(3-hydroxybutyrate) depolymerase